MPPPLYVSDLDGTLLDGNALLSLRSRAIIASLLADGLQFSVATARSVVSVRSILVGLALKLPVVEFNGAFLSDLESGRHWVVHSLPPGLADDLHGLILESGHAPFVSTFNGNCDCLYYDELQNAGMKWYRDDRLEHSDPRLRRVSSTKEALHEQVVCLTVIGRRGPLEELKDRVFLHAGPQVELHIMPHLYSEGWDWLTIHDHKATKDQGIRALRDCCGLNEAELVVFGDGANDVKMFRAADRGIAVANATSELKDVSHAIIRANVDDSVALYLQEAWRDRPENRAHVPHGLGSVGAVVGATCDDAAQIAEQLPLSYILAPGVGAQGATLEDVAARFQRARDRVLPSVSRALISQGTKPAEIRTSLRALRDKAKALLP